jgi:hypothetical protein
MLFAFLNGTRTGPTLTRTGLIENPLSLLGKRPNECAQRNLDRLIKVVSVLGKLQLCKLPLIHRLERKWQQCLAREHLKRHEISDL